MRKEKENPNHRMGKQTGYELIDGEYHIAPLYQDRFENIIFKKKGIGDMLKIVTTHASEDLENLIKLENRIWKDLTEDIGLDTKVNWTYNRGIVTKVPEKQ